MPETRPISEHELSETDREIINMDAAGKSRTKKFNQLWKKKDGQDKPKPKTPEEILH